jgi:hypothetical protein
LAQPAKNGSDSKTNNATVQLTSFDFFNPSTARSYDQFHGNYEAPSIHGASTGYRKGVRQYTCHRVCDLVDDRGYGLSFYATCKAHNRSSAKKKPD